MLQYFVLIEHSGNYSKTSGSLWQYYRGKTFLDDNEAIDDFHADNNNSVLFKFNQKIRGKTADGGGTDVELTVALKYLSNFG